MTKQSDSLQNIWKQELVFNGFTPSNAIASIHPQQNFADNTDFRILKPFKQWFYRICMRRIAFAIKH